MGVEEDLSEAGLTCDSREAHSDWVAVSVALVGVVGLVMRFRRETYA